MVDFYQTVMGKRFFEGQIPKIIASMDKLAGSMDRLSSAIEKSNELAEKKAGGYAPAKKVDPGIDHDGVLEMVRQMKGDC